MLWKIWQAEYERSCQHKLSIITNSLCVCVAMYCLLPDTMPGTNKSDQLSRNNSKCHSMQIHTFGRFRRVSCSFPACHLNDDNDNNANNIVYCLPKEESQSNIIFFHFLINDRE